MGGVGCDNMSVVLVCFMHRDSYGDLVYRCSRDFKKVPRTRRLSCMDSMDRHKLKNRDRRMSEPPLLTRAPIIPAKLACVSDDLLPNGLTCEGTSGQIGDVEDRVRDEEEDEDIEDSEIVVPLETTL